MSDLDKEVRHILGGWIELWEVQDKITTWAQEQFPHRTDFHALYKLVMEEIPELVTHKKEHGLTDIGPEWADCMILLLDLASLWGIDPVVAIKAKMETNYGRTWTKDPETGVMQHAEPPAVKIMPECPDCKRNDYVSECTDLTLGTHVCSACPVIFGDDCPF